MKFTLSMVLFVALVPMLTVDATAQNNSSAAQSVAELRAQLADESRAGLERGLPAPQSF